MIERRYNHQLSAAVTMCPEEQYNKKISQIDKKFAEIHAFEIRELGGGRGIAVVETSEFPL
jgi:hypothetical protein